MKYVIDSKIYEKHIDDKVHLYGLLHQLAFLAEKAETPEAGADLIKTAIQFGKVAEEKYASWNIPSRYLVLGERADLAELKAAELEPLTEVLKGYDRKKAEEKQTASLHDTAYIISGSSFRLLVGDLFSLLAQYSFLRNRMLDLKTEAQLARLQKQCTKENPVIRRILRGWGISDSEGVTCCDMLEKAIAHAHLSPYEAERADHSLSKSCDLCGNEYE